MFEFEVYGYYETPAKLGDLTLHKIIDSLNSELWVNKRREFYHMDAKSAYDFLRAVAELSGTEDRMKLLDEDDEVIPEKTKRRPPFSFKAAGIPFGSVIQFRKNPEIIAKVKDDRHIIYKEKTMYVSELAQILLNVDYVVQGTLYFLYDGEVLNDRRNRFESEGKYGK